MASNTSEDAQLSFMIPHVAVGFRLHRLEVFNWGTFHRKVWALEAGGQTSLLTGDIGSGKSTLVDALTTLLVAPQRVNYNKAAGAEARERSLRSYILGYYKSERGDLGYAARPVMLRDEQSYSVILGTFHNDALSMGVTLAQVFWVRDKNDQPERFYVLAHQDLTVERDFSHFGSNLHDLKRRLANIAHCHVKETFKEYEAHFRRVFGIRNQQALDLFSQAVSMKSVGNLTQFVREHMLEPFDVGPRITNLVQHFDDLHRAHEAVLKAKHQIEILAPLVAAGLDFEQAQGEIAEWQALVDAIPAYVGQQRVELLTAELDSFRQNAIALGQKSQAAEAELRASEQTVADLRRDIEQNGGQRLTQITREIAFKEEQKSHRKARWDKYCGYIETLGLVPAQDLDHFADNHQALTMIRSTLDASVVRLSGERDQLSGDLRDEDNGLKPVVAELESLTGRRTNIPTPQIEVRSQLARAIGVPEEELPFVGELIQVDDQEAMWEGAIERLLRNFGLSLLVPAERYGEIAAWVEKTHLNGRLVYYQVRMGTVATRPPVHAQSVVHKIRLKPQTPFHAWLDAQLASRFDYVCTQSLDDFRREMRAMTPAGQIKGRDRHEKDDRYRIQDRTRYVLGWDNRHKIEALEAESHIRQQRIASIQHQMTALERELRGLDDRRSIVDRVAEITDYQDVNWVQLAAEIAELQEERRRLEQTSDILRSLQQRLAEGVQELDAARARQRDLQGKMAVNENQVTETTTDLAEAKAALGQTVATAAWDVLWGIQGDHCGLNAITVKRLPELERCLRDQLNRFIREASQRRESLGEHITTAMARYQTAFPVEGREMDVRVAALPEYRDVMDRLQADDLPRFEGKFKTLLNENTIREIVHFQAQLGKERDLIRERVAQINRSLAEVQYNPGRYIRLDADQNPDREIREFQQQLRVATEGTLTGSDEDQYSEAKFLQVKAIVERFRGREGMTDRDRVWTAKVTDVRHEFTFSASERWIEDDSEYEHYTDSGGKSGGQKEKLAYTILAASLAYQFGEGKDNPRSFRFVVIDEAFGRGSDESARFGLELFRHLNLQLLIVTPLQKIHVIEPFIANVAFVHNLDGNDSQIRNISIEDYRTEREARRS